MVAPIASADPVVEGDTAYFPVYFNGSLAEGIDIPYHTIDGSALSGVDFVGVPEGDPNGFVSVDADSVLAMIPVQTLWNETGSGGTGSRNFTVALGNGGGPAPSGSPASATIQRVAVNLNIDGIAEGDEESLGGLVVLRADGNEAPRKRIELICNAPLNWDGTVVLHRNNSKLRIFRSNAGIYDEIAFGYGNVHFFKASQLPPYLFVQGAGASAEMRDAQLTLCPEGAWPGTAPSDTVRFTVLWVGGPTVTFDGIIPENNRARNVYSSINLDHDFALNKHHFVTDALPWYGYGLQTSALVLPTHFNYPGSDLKFVRDRDRVLYGGLNGDVPKKAAHGRDLVSDPALRDYDPTVGILYDLDAPGPPMDLPLGRKGRYRANFSTYGEVTIGDKSVRASLVRTYYVHMSIERVNVGGTFIWLLLYDLPSERNDNTAAYDSGITQPITWDLQ